MSLSPVMKHFIHAPKFAVIGRILTDPSRFDAKVLSFYTNNHLPVTPVIPSAASSSPASTVNGLAVLDDPLAISDISNTAISVIINPKIGAGILEKLYSDGKERGPWAVWFQPGAENNEIAAFVKSHGLEDKVVYGGPCVLRSSRALLAERQSKHKL